MKKKVEGIKETYTKLSKKLSQKAGGVDQYVDLKLMANKLGINVTKLFRGKNYETDFVSGRYEIWFRIPGSSSKVGKGNSLGEAVKDAVATCATYADL